MGEQIKINFNEQNPDDEALFQEKVKITLAHKIILHKGDSLEKELHKNENGIWYVGDETLQEYANRQDELYTDDKNTPYWQK